jgi:hypothetical protein
MLGFFHHRGDVQQRLGRNAADVQADAAEGGVALDDHGLHAEVGRAEGGRVAAGAGAEHEHVALDVGPPAWLAATGAATGAAGADSGAAVFSGPTAAAAAPASTLISTRLR